MTVFALVEGQTEEAFIKNCLFPHLKKHEIYIQPIVVSTKRVLSGLKTTGGLSNGNLTKFLSDLNNLIHSLPPGAIATTMIDYYALPNNFPGYEKLKSGQTSLEKIKILQQSLHECVGHHKSFIPYIQMHEFEALLFSHPVGFKNCIDPREANINGLLEIIAEFDNPELINDRRETAPSKRIKTCYPQYSKVFLGNMIALEIGIDRIIEKCPRFRTWIEQIVLSKT